MNKHQKQSKDSKIEIITQIAELSWLLGMIPSDETIHVHEPLTQNQMILSAWFSKIRKSFLRLSLLLSKELDIQLQ